MSLRDQLLKSGLANKKQVKKAENAAKKKQHHNQKGKKAKKSDQPPANDDELKQEIERQRQAQKERDRQLNLQREQERREREKASQAGELIVSRDCRDRRADTSPYYFVTPQKTIHAIEVTEKQQEKLAAGKMGIATLQDEDYYLLSAEDCTRVQALKADFIVCWHREPEPSS